jgi:hypothetical protein
MRNNSYIKSLSIAICLVCIFLSCNRQKPDSGYDGSNNKIPIPVSTIIDSTAFPQKSILRDENAISVSHSLRELDTDSISKYQISIFRSKEEIFRIDSFTSQIKQISFTNGKIDTFFLSPNRKYVACIKIVVIGKEPGLWEGEEAPNAARYGILVINTLDNSVVREIRTSQWNLCIDKWISNSRLLYTTDDGFAVSDFYIYDALRDTLQRLPYGSEE